MFMFSLSLSIHAHYKRGSLRASVPVSVQFQGIANVCKLSRPKVNQSSDWFWKDNSTDLNPNFYVHRYGMENGKYFARIHCHLF